MKKSDELRLQNIWGAISLATVDKMEQAFAAATKLGPSAIAAIGQIGYEMAILVERVGSVVQSSRRTPQHS